MSDLSQSIRRPRGVATGVRSPGRRPAAPSRRAPTGRGLWLVLLLVTAGLPQPSAASGRLYRFVDERGVIHFSNVPNDPRFEQIWSHERSRRGRRGGPPDSTTYDLLISRQAADQRVPPALVKALIAAESAFDPRALSPKGAQGLMQLMPATAESLGVANPFRATENISGGVRYLRTLLDRYDDLTHVLAAYNAGPEAVDRYQGVPPYKETQQYVERVMAYYRHYDAEFAR